MSVNVAIHGSYNLGLVALSIVLAVVSSYAALDLGGRVASTRGRVRAVWLAGGGVSMGIGIWAMHYVGMLALAMPMPVLYHVPTVVVSLLAAIFASSVALFVVGRPQKLGRELGGGLMMGLGIAAMHYIGMAAMRCPAVITYDRGIVACSLLLAAVISFIALKLTFQVRDRQRTDWQKIVSALAMGSAIPLMHYVGMWAATFRSSPAPIDLTHSVRVSMIGVLSITIASFFVLGGAIASAFIDRLLVLYRSDLRALAESESYFHTLAETIPEIIWTANPDGATDFSNKRWLEYSGLTVEQTRGSGWTKAVHPDDLNDCRSKWEHAQRTGSPYRAEMRLRSKNGNYRHFLVCANPLRDSRGAIAKWFGTCTDIEAQKESQKILEGSKQLADANLRLTQEQYFRTMADALPEMIWTADRQGQVDYVNSRIDYTGRTMDQIRGSGWNSMIHPDDLPAAMEKWQTSIRTGQTFAVENRLQVKDGTFRWFLVRAKPIRNHAGEITRWIGICTDIEDQKHDQEVLQQRVLEQTKELADANTRLQEEYYFRTMANGIPDIIWTADPAGTLDYMNRTDFSGRSFGQVAGVGWMDAIHADDLPAVMAKWENSLRTKEAYEVEYRLKGQDGAYHWFLVRSNPIRNAEGELVKWIGTCIDIETQKQSQKILEQHLLERTRQLKDANMRLHEEAYFHQMADAIPHVILTSSGDGDIDYCNQYTMEYTGLTLEQIRGSGWMKAVVHPDDVSARAEKWETALRTREPFDLEYRLRRKDGTFRWFLLLARPVCDEAGHIEKWIGTCTDIENQKENQRILEVQVLERTSQLADANTRLHTESYFRLMADAVPELIWTTDAQGQADYCNRYTLDYSGLTITELAGMGWLEAAVHPDDREARQEKLERALRTGEPYDLEYRLRGKDGEYRWFLLRARPIRNDAGEILKWIGTCTDIESQKQNQKVLEEQILERTMQLEDANVRLHEEMVEKDFARNELDIQNEKMMSELEKRSERATMLAKMGELLQSCISRDEVFAAALGYAPKIFPTVRGALALLNNARSLAEIVGSWAECTIPAQEFEPSQCWALRTGQPHFVVPGDTTARCRHAEGVNATYLCVPIMAQGETLGIVHFQVTQESPRMDPSELSFKTTFAGQVGLSIANIRLREALRTQSVRDALTGLFNRRYLEEILEREVRRAGRAGQSLGILMLDLDHFKRFNDTYGHDAGDTVLRETAALLLKNVRAEDFVCRFGGEEFVVILPTADQEGARGRGERLRDKMRDLPIMHQGKSLGMITFSIGIAAFPQHGTSPKELMAAADVALYEAKRGGRDQVVVATKAAAELVVPEVAKSAAG